MRWDHFYRRKELGFTGAIGLALACVAAAVAARLLLGLFGSTLPFATFFPAVLICALIGGRNAGLIAIPLSVLAVWWVIIPPAFTFAKPMPNELANFILFALSSLLVVALAVFHRRNVFALQDKERQRELLVHEIEHRSKNMLAVMTALVRQTVKDNEVAQTLIERMCIAADNRDLLGDTTAHEQNLRELIAAVVRKPSGDGRITFSGPDVRLKGDQARSLRIVFHEMTTNAVKYGALSAAGGRIAIDWTLDGNSLAIHWRERGGPKVAPPTTFNFGSKLISVTLRQMNAEFEPTFAETGYCFRIAFELGST